MARAQKTTPNRTRLLVIACGMIAREVLAVKERNGARPSRPRFACRRSSIITPNRIAPAMDKAIAEARDKGYRHIFAGYADCGTGGLLDRVLEKHGVERVAGPHCFAFYQGNAAFEAIAEDDMTSFYMTDFLCRQFDAFFMKPLRLDKHPELIKDFFGNYEKVVYLAQTDDPELDRVAENAAKTARPRL